MIIKIDFKTLAIAAVSSLWLSGCEDKESEPETKIVYVTEYVYRDAPASTDTLSDKINTDSTSDTENTNSNSTTNSNNTNSNDGDDVAATGALSLSFTPTQVGIRPPAQSSSGGSSNLRLLSSGFSLVPDTSPMAQFDPMSYTWDPSQVPMKSMNKVLGVVAETAYPAFIGKGRYIAKVKLDEIFGRGESGSQMYQSNNQNNQTRVKTTDVLVEATKGSDGKVRVRLWFARELSNMDPQYWMLSKMPSGGGTPIAPVLNYEVAVEVISTVQEVGPYGEFKMTYLMAPSYNGVEDTTKGIMRGYLDIIRDTDTQEIDITYNERTTTTQSWDNGGTTVSSTTRIEQMAQASLTLTDNQVTSGIAVTESKYSTTSAHSSYRNESGAYYIAFDYLNGSTNTSITNRGRAIIDYDPETTGWYPTVAGFDPAQARCEEIGDQGTVFAHEGYVAFDTNGEPIDTQTSLRLNKVDGNAEEGCWVSQWGTSCWGGAISNGTRLYSNRQDGSKIYFTATPLKGALRNSTTWKDVTVTASSNISLSCTSRCPKPDFTAAELNDQWSFSPSMFLSGTVEYVFDTATRELKYTNAGVTSVISMPEGASGYLSINLTSGSDSYMYEMNSYGQNIMLVKDGESLPFQPPQPLKFVNESFVASRHARPNSIYPPSMSNLSDASYSWGAERSLKLDGNWLNVDWFAAANKYTNITMSKETDGTLKFSLGWGQSVGLNEQIKFLDFSLSQDAGFPLDTNTTYYAIPVPATTSGGFDSFYLAASANGSGITFVSGNPTGSTTVSLPTRRALYDQWGNFVYLPKLSLALGVELTLDGDPDGSGPRYSGEKVHLVPSSIREQAIVRSGSDADCAAHLTNKISDAKDTMSPPGALPSFKFDTRLSKTVRPTGSFPVRAINGTPVIE
jgi:hypothetical protein